VLTLADLTTLRVGGRPRRLVDARSADAAVAALRSADSTGEEVLVVGGGSNLLVADGDLPLTVVRITSRGVDTHASGERVIATVSAGEPWDPFVDRCVGEGLAGVECLSGIPGLTGATPIQNVGAYGQEVSETIVAVRAYDRAAGSVVELDPASCEFSYRSSAFKRTPGRWLVLAVSFALKRGDRSTPIRYPELARELGIELGGTAPLPSVREAVLRVRARKGMVIDPADADSASAGSFFTNPILDAGAFARLRTRARERLGPDVSVPSFPQDDGRIKTSAAWLVDRAGFGRGYGMPGPAAISTKHALALTNRGGATAADLLALARAVADGVRDRFDVELVPEPVLVGLEWSPMAAAR
jgi:UDP-N-acetylmuramate dehydrogenase